MASLSRENLIYDVQAKSRSIALIYSPLELNEYIVELISKTSDTFISKNDNISHFLSVHDAITRAKEQGATEFFLCVDNTYDECGSIAATQRFDYLPINSH